MTRNVKVAVSAKTRMGQLAMAVWLAVWAAVLAVCGFWLGRWGLDHFTDESTMRLAAIALFGAAVLLWVGLKGFYVVADLLRGRTTPRLAKRDFRNSLSNILMGAKTGMWKE